MITILKQFSGHTKISIYALVLGAASQYLDGFLESNSRNCDIILAVIVAFSDSARNLVTIIKKMHDFVNNCK